MNDFIFSYDTKVYFGKDSSAKALASELKDYRRIMLAYGGGSIKKNGIYDEIIGLLSEKKRIPIPESQATVTEESRFDDGSAAQTELFGNLGDTKPAEGEVRLGRSFLPDYCFGDFYTRTGLTLEEHELLTWVCIAALGDAEAQLTGHTNGNKNVGKSKEYMLEVLTDIMPYIGYPRTLNALSIINSVYDAQE